jgi:hypothetical protein
LQAQHRVRTHGRDAVRGDDGWVAQAVEDVVLGPQPLRVVVVAGDLEDFVLAVPFGQEDDGGAAGAEPGEDLPSGDGGATACGEQVDVVGGGKVVLGQLEPGQQLRHRRESLGDVGCRRPGDHIHERGRSGVHGGGERDGPVFIQQALQPVGVGCRRLAADHEVCQPAEGEHVGQSTRGVGHGAQLRREIWAGVLACKPQEVPWVVGALAVATKGRSLTCNGGPTTQAGRRCALRVCDPYMPWGQRPVRQAMLVRVRDSLGDAADHGQSREQVRVRVRVHPVVEPHGLGVVRGRA